MKTTQRRVPKLALSGGPGGGKTKLAKFIAKKAAAKGYVAQVVPEAATILMDSGVSPHGGRAKLLDFQHAVLKETLSRERFAEEALLAGGHEKPLLIFDRGVPDIGAYVSENDYRSLLKEHGLSHHALSRDGRYDAVVYMRTAADGAERHYSNRSNKFRSEDLDAARALDRRTLDAWIGHQHLSVVGNSYNSFRGKLEAGWREACRLLGIPEPREIEKRYLVKPVDFTALGIPHRTIDVTQHYLALPRHNDETNRVRSWGEDGHATYTFTRKRMITPGEMEEIEEHISETAFAQFTKYQDQTTVAITKRRTCFVYKDQYFMYDEFLSGRPGLTVLEIEIASQKSTVLLPPFVTVLEDVTFDREYSSRAIAEIT
ncbi:MAG: hypothetical protein A3C93_05075 [Candidatus Lloydbacteria bacterium RIFCSPHIGHO2_02_FULL_54_17]|uniref:NadR/Ttd14 AAA domain-containing protein n=1 Tax=Candidatus Lloydbacteria bacterium RIFCSPHIGHO2_02_FULL_54_17 TaxID=1798664 RepID=A0A1G2DDH7_9BACT|nr:MAG: hypothetical protein A2762_06120 [Candidatus Lloydbacteria bacterium RIFCSPHIGHO2_01_FULL_54_11]OGZ10838.1 MAG: hypothetical protein A3C93_05075 [Candidatus Lloydbacteria bacterium RIFCSPHIGHO2_02_FULL_54_17]OGZ13263.1 MAG: hypothetical protein A2948_02960 [Candidatus Lloydbacteria bacterium RIFCSPLOWO2_01_FULL_54_18]